MTTPTFESTCTQANDALNLMSPAVSEVENALKNIKTTLDSCVPLVKRLNTFLPEERRLERFKLNPEIESEEEEEEVEQEQMRGEGESGRGQSINEDSQDFDTTRTNL